MHYFRFLLLFSLLIVTCSEDDPVETKGSVFGRITEDVSNEAIVAAQVSISGVQQSISTGQDGSYQFSDITADSYTITASKSGYLTDVKTISVVAGSTSNGDFSLEKELPTINPSSVSLDNETTEVTLQLQNTRSSVMNFTTDVSQDWLEVSPANSSIDPLNTKLLTLTADLVNVPFGEYEEVLIINVGQASLSIPITVSYIEPPNISITTPDADQTYVMGEVMPINWNSNLEGNVEIELYRFSSVFLTISEEETNINGGNYSWEIPALEEANYQLKVTSLENDEIFDITDAFSIISGPTKPTVVNGSVTELLSTSIKIEGEITNIGLEATQVDQHGHVYSQNNTNPSIADFKTNLGSTSSIIEYESNITGLEPGVSYYVNAYATNSQGTSYGDVITITPPAGAPIVTTTSVSEITNSSAITGGNVISDGGNNLTERGLCWGTTSPVTIDSNTIQDGQNIEGSFTTSLTGLGVGSTYYVRAYAINSEGIGYGEQISFSTSAGTPTVETISGSTVDTNTIAVNGEVSDNGGADLNSYGFVYSNSDSTPTTSNSVIEVGDNIQGQFNTEIDGLQPSTSYYVRAYATNEVGTSYGNIISVETEEGSYFNIISPELNEAIDVNTSYNIQWESNYENNERLVIQHYRDGEEISEITNSAYVDEGVYEWFIANDMQASTTNQIRIFLYDTLEEVTMSIEFEITQNFYLIGPQSGDQFDILDILISWGINYETDLKFELFNGSTNLGLIAEEISSSTGEYNWDASLTSAQPEPNNNYRIKITDQENQISVISDEFSVTCNLQTYYQDNDNDGYGNADIEIQACYQPEGYVTNDTDVNDNDPSINQAVYLAENGITIKANVGAQIGDTGVVNGVLYTVVDEIMLSDWGASGLDYSTACTTRITDLGSLFMNTSSLFDNIGNWDVSNVTNMNNMFYNVFPAGYNQDIGNWDVSNVTDMQGMFWEASAFNQDIGNWDVSSVTDMGVMFNEATDFNQDIGDWDVSNVTAMYSMFYEASAFNQDLNGWCVSNFSSAPYGFSTNSALTAIDYPVWGTCP